MEPLIDLQAAHINQQSNGESKTPWSVQKNVTNEELFELPGNLSESEIFTIMKFARKFELTAFNTGIQFGKETTKKEVNGLREVIAGLETSNTKLAEKLGSFIGEEAD